MLVLVATLLTAIPLRAIDGGCLEPNGTSEAVRQLLADGNVAFEAEDTTKAEAAWLKIRECAPATPEWPKAVFNLGLLESKRNNFPKAITYFDEVLQSHPNDQEEGGSLMETNRNYSHRSALAISNCYESMGSFAPALRYTWLAKTKYRYYSWCGTCLRSANFGVNKRIAYLAMRASRVHIWAGMLLFALVALRWKSSRSGKQLPDS